MRRALLAIFAAALLMLGAGVVMAQDTGQPQKDNTKPLELTDDITPPKLLEVAMPTYTENAKKKKIEGTVVVSIVVNTKGDVTDAKVVKSLDPELDQSALVAVKMWRYKPATKDDEPVAVRMDVNLDFHLPLS